MTIKQAMILAAGFGTRLGAMTQITPKPMINVGAQPILFRILDALNLRKFETVVINTHYLADQIHKAVELWRAENGDSNMNIIISHEDELLEIGGGLNNALNHFNHQPFLVVNGDIVWQEARHPLLDELTNAFDAEAMDALLVISPVEQTQAFRNRGGDFVMTANNRIHFPEEGEKPLYVYAGIQVIHPRMLAVLSEGRSPLRPAWIESQNQGKLSAFVYEQPWADMGTPQGLEYAQDLVKKYTAKCA